VLFQLDERSWECRACVIDPAHGVRAIDRRGDTLRTPEQIAQELGLRTAIALHLAVRERLPGIDYGPLPDLPALPADYVQLLAVLDRASRVDAEFGNALSELRLQYEKAACFSPRQMLLVQWRLAKCGIEHEPSRFAVSLRSDKEIAQIRNLSDWQKKNIAPYLSWSQRSKFGF
jgi:hypothetical protein